MTLLFVVAQVKAAGIIPPVVGSPDNYKQLYENAVAELNKRATDEAERLRAAMRMQGEEDVAKFCHFLLRELLAERERLQRVLDSKLAAMKDVYASEMQKREDAYALRIEQAVGTVRDVAVARAAGNRRSQSCIYQRNATGDCECGRGAQPAVRRQDRGARAQRSGAPSQTCGARPSPVGAIERQSEEPFRAPNDFGSAWLAICPSFPPRHQRRRRAGDARRS